MNILGIETSCDDTGISILNVDKTQKITVIANKVSSQIKLHAKWGGVVPNLAAREHSKNIIPILKKTLAETKIKPANIDLIAVTKGPGLIPALLVGTNFAKTLSYLWKKPLIGIHHIEGHIYANFLQKENAISDINFPLLALVVSGGHTQLILMNNHLQYKIIGETQDDAVGEAFDKVARILNLGYPGGPIISQKADDFSSSFKTNNTTPNFKFPRPMFNSSNFNFSFSGLKTAVLYKTEELEQLLTKEKFEQLIPKICFEFQEACLDVLIHKTIRATAKYQPKTVVLCGGVSANKELRQQLGLAIKKDFKNISYLIPDFQYTADNASMIAIAGYFRWKNMDIKKRKLLLQNWKTLQANAGLKITS
ncbi:MAG TPA: tRNA (adenosine(37)-N6)-threonylcarbamoyltransferase complex transferase subunit TsaD [Candidatus Moranbacteria bacterium]|nr:tRNA (adenosine(37)-N6)-threonylcarbamoyltransferase complex transferase subunit TsaD [Candidatus Moranbacteria bacterium]